MIEFDAIKKVDPRSIWKHEAHDFTPWLAENLNRLGEAIGIELELLEREADVGDFSLDLLAIDLGRNAPVIIENQLATTDHDHLGKLITYASGYDARVVVWVSTEIREEHRQALDWLNQRTDSNTDFFAVVVEVIQIGDSKPALQFRVAVSPNEWQKSARKEVNNNDIREIRKISAILPGPSGRSARDSQIHRRSKRATAELVQFLIRKQAVRLRPQFCCWKPSADGNLHRQWR